MSKQTFRDWLWLHRKRYRQKGTKKEKGVIIDTVAHGGGREEPFFWSLDVTDAQTQWTEFSFCWCRSAAATLNAFEIIRKRLPFPVRKLHPDNGGEVLNCIFPKHLEEHLPEIEITRSRPMTA